MYQRGSGCKRSPKGRCAKYDGPDTEGCAIGPGGRCRIGARLAKAYAPKQLATETQLANLRKARAARVAYKSGVSRPAPKPSATKKPRTSAWIQHVKSFRASNPGMSYKDAMQYAKATYKSKGTVAPVQQRVQQRRQQVQSLPVPASLGYAPFSGYESGSACTPLSQADCMKHPRCNWLGAVTKKYKKSGKSVTVAAHCGRSPAKAMKKGVLRQTAGGYWW